MMFRISLWALILFAQTAGAFDTIDTAKIFPAVAQGTHGSSTLVCDGISNTQLILTNNPKINGTGGAALAFCSQSPNPNKTPQCDDGQGGYKVCQITNADIQGLSLIGNNTFPDNGSTLDISCNNGGTRTLDQANYRTISGDGCQMSFTGGFTRHQITTLTLRNNTRLTLGAGDYFIENLSLDGGELIFSDPALTRIFVKNATSLRNQIGINRDGRGNLIWVSYADVTMESQTDFTGYLYTNGTLDMRNTSLIKGRVTARYLRMDAQSSITDKALSLPSTTPDCGAVFTDPPSAGAIMTPPPGMLEPPLGDLTCEMTKGGTTCIGAPNGSNVFPPGDYDFNRGVFSNKSELVTPGVTARLYFNDLSLNNAELNAGGAAENLIIYVKGSLNVAGQNRINGILYVAGDVRMTGNSSLRGAIAAGGSIDLGGNNNFQFLQDAVNNADFGGMCKKGAPELSCSSYTFDASGSLGGDWATKVSSGSFTPASVSGRMRLTQSVTNQATAASYLRLFPGTGNLVTMTFDQYAYTPNSSSSGADGMAIVISDAKIQTQPGAFGGPLGYGYKSGVPGFAGGWLGIGLDEYGNYSAEGGSSNVGRRQQSVVVRGAGSGQSGYRYLKGTCANGTTNTNIGCLVPPVSGQGGSKYQVSIDSRLAGSALVTVKRDTGSGWQTLIDTFDVTKEPGQGAVPDNFLLSLTGSTGSLSNVHEVDNVEVCSLAVTGLGTLIDHFEFDHSGNALTCQKEGITLRACANAACSSLVTEQVMARLTPGSSASGNWLSDSPNGEVISDDVVTFKGGVARLYLSQRTPMTVTLGVSNSTPGLKPLSTTLCRAGSGALSAAACQLAFADSGFLFDVPDTFANKPQQVSMRAVKKDSASQACVPGFANVNKTITFSSNYVTPASNAFGSKVRVNGQDVAAGVSQTLAFDSQGATPLTVSYPDAGQVQLNARHDGSGSTAGLVMTGSDQFVARPVGLCITPTQGGCPAGDASCAPFRKTGETFELGVAGMAWQADNDTDLCSGNLPTPNFALTNVALGSQLVAPKPGVEANLGVSRYDHLNQASDNRNRIMQTVSEVGVFRLTATPPANGYFGYSIPAATSVPVGRFVPWDFQLASGDIQPACNDFSYMSQPFGVSLDVVARNHLQARTLNYTGAFAKGGAFLAANNNKDGQPLSGRLRALGPLPWQNGQAALTGASLFARLSDTQPDGPYKKLLFGLYMADNDGNRTLIANPDFNEQVQGDCSGGNCNARLLDPSTMAAYFGRLLAGTETGIATEPLAIKLLLQSFEAGGWRLQQEDHLCTQLSLANDGVQFLNSNHHYDAASRQLDLGGGRKITLGLGAQAPGGESAKTNKGEVLFHFAAPGIAVRIPYRFDLAKQPGAPLWLSDPASQQGEAIFGSSRGNDRIIYRREIMQ